MWLWNKLPPLPDNGPSNIDGFQIYCNVDRPNLKFLAICPWAKIVMLRVSMCANEDLEYQRGLPPPIWSFLDAKPWTDLDDDMGSSRSLHQGSAEGKYFPTRAIDVHRVKDGMKASLKAAVPFQGTRATSERRRKPQGWDATACETDPSGYLKILAKDWPWRPHIKTVYKAAGLEIAKSASKALSGQNGITRDEETVYLSLWGDLVSIYANCALTNESDRLIAISGIAKTFQEATKDEYLAGLWRKVIHSDLTWKTNAGYGAEVIRSDSYAPTWSWASVVGGRTSLNTVYQKYGGAPISLINIVAERIVSEPPGDDPTGLLRSAELDVECMLYHYRWTSQLGKLAVFKDEAKTELYFGEKFSPSNLHLDTVDMFRKFEEMPVDGANGSVSGLGPARAVPSCDLQPMDTSILFKSGAAKNSGSPSPRIIYHTHYQYNSSTPITQSYHIINCFTTIFISTVIMKTTAMLMIAAFASSALSLEVKDASTPGGGTPGSPACGRQCLITISPVDGASTQRSDGFPGSCKEYATGQLKGINRSVDGGRLNINGVGGNLVIDFVKNGRDRRASFTNCKEAVYTGAQCSLKQGGCDKQAESG
ncbi:hypothetical protein FNAPI_1613 [Fusarium napiforme]|uniref:Uncharacterized protein n=1 Tax=Fusarium napiforme TaxID=42672 RepID=A0A8H5NHG3_9HYPO|nr:hypothetical protein FNAPI_1613 [Fusarium napiforme]